MHMINPDSATALADRAESSTSRRRFLRRLGVTLGVAVGAAAFAQPAFALGNCCRDCADCGECQGPNGVGCWCACMCPTNSYCWVSGQCLQTQTCVQCPC
jgi:hypothetical protein